jgi:hypothetical protein
MVLEDQAFLHRKTEKEILYSLMTGEGGGVKEEPNHATVLVVYKSWDGAWSSINHSILLGGSIRVIYS